MQKNHSGQTVAALVDLFKKRYAFHFQRFVFLKFNQHQGIFGQPVLPDQRLKGGNA